jgi:hypothetical protein
MPAISGNRMNAIAKIASTWGTAVTGGAGEKLAAEIRATANGEVLRRRSIGSGRSMALDAVRGNVKPTIELAMDAGPRNCMDTILAQFMGTAPVPTLVTVGQGDYRHTITFNQALNAKYLTLAYESSTTTVHEFPTCAVDSIGISLEDAPGILEFTASLMANDFKITGTTNSNASMASATFTDTEVFSYAFDDTFRLNTAAGATLAGGDQLNIVSYDLQLSRPQSMNGELRGAAGNAAPLESDSFAGTLTIGLSSLPDHTFYTYWAAETALKCALNIQGTQIAAGTNRAISILIPRMKLIQEPNFERASAGIDPVELTFEIIEASANPSGMSSNIPYFEIVNTLSTSLLA